MTDPTQPAADDQEAIRAAAQTIAREKPAQADEVIADAVHVTINRTLDAAQELDQAAAAARGGAAQLADTVAQASDATMSSTADAVAASVDASQQVLSDTANAMRDQGEAAAKETTRVATDRVDAFLQSASAMTRGMEEMRRAWVGLAQHALQEAARGPQELLRCQSWNEAAELHRTKLRDAMEQTAQTTRAVFEIGTRTAREASRPLAAAVLPGFRAAE